MQPRHKFDKSRWMLARERLRLADPVPPGPDPDLSIRDAITNIFKKLECQDISIVQQIQKKWALIAGNHIAAHSRPGKLADHVLYVYVDSSSWLNEMARFHSDDIMQEMKTRIGPGVVRSLKFLVNPRECKSQFPQTPEKDSD